MLQSLVNAWREGDFEYRVDYRWVSWNDISASMKLAVIAAEDQRFLQHNGFDFDSIVSAVDDHLEGRRLRGASTISQQVAKNLFLWSGRSYFRKLLEAYFTMLIELSWSKHRILEVYLNTAEFGSGVYGVSSAAHQFFGKRAVQLASWEAASLAAVLPSPQRYRVQNPSPYVKSRRAWILKQMQQLGSYRYLSNTQEDSAVDDKGFPAPLLDKFREF